MLESKSSMIFLILSSLPLIIRSIISILFIKLFAVGKNVSQPFNFEKSLLKRKRAAFKAMLIIKNETKDLFRA